MKYGSCFSGIEAASVAWHPLGWEGQWFSEIEPFPSAVLAHRFPNTPNLGDITEIHNDERFEKSTIDLLVGGSPCQSFSVAGLRKGLSDPRGNLMLTFLSVAERKKPRWIVWENVPGVLSSNRGRDFATFLTALAELGYGFAYRILDAQYFGVAQRRRRVFVVGYLGDWRPAAAVLFESHSLQWNLEKSRKKRKETPTFAKGGLRTQSPDGRESIGTLRGRDYKGIGNDDLETGRGLAIEIKPLNEPTIIDRAAFNQGVNAQYEPYIEEGETMPSLVAKGPHAVAHAFKVRGGSEVETGEQGGTPGKKAGKGYLGQDECVFTIGAVQDQMIAQPIALAENTIGRKPENGGNGDGFTEGGPMYTLNTTGVHGVGQPLAVDCYNQTVNEKTSQTIGSSASDVNHYGAVLQPQILAPTITQCKGSRGGCSDEAVAEINAIQQAQNTMAIRRLTPTECERLQGFPDSWTRIPYRNKPADQCPDGPRYKACGNSMAVPVMRWIGERINLVENLLNQNK